MTQIQTQIQTQTQMEFADGYFVFNTMAVTLKRAGVLPPSGRAARKATASQKQMRDFRKAVDYAFKQHCTRLRNGWFTAEAGTHAVDVELRAAAEEVEALNAQARAAGAVYRLTAGMLSFRFDPHNEHQVEELRLSMIERLGDLFVCLKTGDVVRKVEDGGKPKSKAARLKNPLDAAFQRAAKLELVVQGGSRQLVVEALAEATAASPKVQAMVQEAGRPPGTRLPIRLPALQRALVHFRGEPRDLLDDCPLHLLALAAASPRRV